MTSHSTWAKIWRRQLRSWLNFLGLPPPLVDLEYLDDSFAYGTWPWDCPLPPLFQSKTDNHFHGFCKLLFETFPIFGGPLNPFVGRQSHARVPMYSGQVKYNLTNTVENNNFEGEVNFIKYLFVKSTFLMKIQYLTKKWIVIQFNSINTIIHQSIPVI